MYTKSQQSAVTYREEEGLFKVLQKHKDDLNLIKFGVTGNHKPLEIKSLADVFDYWMKGTRTVFLNGEVHCRQKASRSDLDLFLLCRYYFSMSYQKFKEYFDKLNELRYNPYGHAYGHSSGSYVLYRSHCATIVRRVYFHAFNNRSHRTAVKELLDKNFGKVKLKISKIPNIGERL
jgi:hypothetical protein